MATFTFNQHEKLKSKKLTELLFKEGKAFHSYPFRVVYLFAKPEFKIPESKDFKQGYPFKFGISVSAKNFKKATDRNTIKRRGREAWRLHKEDCYIVANQSQKEMAVFFIYTQKELLDYAAIEKGIINGMNKLIGLIQSVPSTPDANSSID